MRRLLPSGAAALAALVLAGCGAPGSPAMVARAAPAELRDERSEDLCNALAFYRAAPLVSTDDARAELVRRGEFTPDEWTLIDGRKLRIGMRELAAVCSWGYPDARNDSASAAGGRSQWVYGSAFSPRARYVYVEGGRVAGWN